MRAPFFIAASLATLALLSPVHAQTSAAPAPRTMKIAVVDLTRAVAQYHHREVLEKDLKELQANLDRQDKARQNELKKLNAEIDQLAMGSPERIDLEKRVKELTANAESGRRAGFEQLNHTYVEMIQTLYAEITKEIESLAAERDYDLVIKDQSSEPELRNATIQQISQRVVLFCKPEYDLTSAVVERLNARYDAEQKAKGSAKEAVPTDSKAKQDAAQATPATPAAEERKP